MMSSFIHHTIRDFLSLKNIYEIESNSIINFLMKRFSEEKFPQDYFICIFINILDLKTMNLEYLGLGFQDLPVLIRNNQVKELESKGMPISPVIPEDTIKSNFEVKHIVLKDRDTLFFNTDGLVEQKNGDDDISYLIMKIND